MRTTYVKVWTWVAVAACIAPARAGAQLEADPDRATTLEAEAARLQDQTDRWADAASLYVAAAQMRQREDPQARQDLFIAANLMYQLGDRAGAVKALDSAGSRALSAGDSVFATEMFANAANIAREAGLGDHERRLRSRVANLANGSARRRTRS